MANQQSQVQTQRLIQTQKLIQDQHYSNGIFYALMSTLQSLYQVVSKGSTSEYGNKMFRSYDKFDYKFKNIQALKCQLQIHLMAFNNIMILFRKEYPGQWRLPQNFDQKMSVHFIQLAMKLFQKTKEYDCFYLARDILIILNGEKAKLYIDQHDFTPSFASVEQRKAQTDLFGNCMQAQQQMHARQNEIRKLTNVSQLTAEINQESQFYQQIYGQHRKHKGQNVGNKQKSKQHIIRKQRYEQLLKLILRNIEYLQTICQYIEGGNKQFKKQQEKFKKDLQNKIIQAQTEKQLILKEFLQCHETYEGSFQRRICARIKQIKPGFQKKSDIMNMLSLFEAVLQMHEEIMVSQGNQDMASQIKKNGGRSPANITNSNMKRSVSNEKDQNRVPNSNNTKQTIVSKSCYR